MAKYSEELERLIPEAFAQLAPDLELTCKKMFGGLCYLLQGNMLCGVHKEYLILRLGEAEAVRAMGSPHARAFDITGRPMKGWVMVDEVGFKGEQLQEWLAKAKAFVGTLEPK